MWTNFQICISPLQYTVLSSPDNCRSVLPNTSQLQIKPHPPVSQFHPISTPRDFTINITIIETKPNIHTNRNKIKIFFFSLQKTVHFLTIIMSKHLLSATRDSANMSATKVANPEYMIIWQPCLPNGEYFKMKDTPRGSVISVQCNKSIKDRWRINTVVVLKLTSSPCLQFQFNKWSEIWNKQSFHRNKNLLKCTFETYYFHEKVAVLHDSDHSFGSCLFLTAAYGIVINVDRFPRIPKAPTNICHIPAIILIVSVLWL